MERFCWVQIGGGTVSAHSLNLVLDRPRTLSRRQQAQHLAYVLDGAQIATVYERKILRW
jgi:hypothetical protein